MALDPGAIVRNPVSQTRGARAVTTGERLIRDPGQRPRADLSGFNALAYQLNRIGNVAEEIGQDQLKQYATKVAKESADAGARDAMRAESVADLRLPTGTTTAEVAYARSMQEVGRNRLQLAALQDVDRLEEQYSGDPVAFRQTLDTLVNDQLQRVDPAFAPDLANIYGTLGVRAERGIADRQKALRIDEAHGQFLTTYQGLTNRAQMLAMQGDIQGATAMMSQVAALIARSGPVEEGGSGVFTAAQQAKLGLDTLEGTRVAGLRGQIMRDPQGMAAVLGEQLGAPAWLVAAESGGNPGVVNAQGFAGLHQFGTARLAELGVYEPAPGESLQSNQWKGHFTGLEGVTTLQDFLANPTAQQQVFALHQENIDEQAKRDGLTKFSGRTINGVVVSPESIRAMAHLGGYAGAKRFIETGGQYDPADANGTHLSDYGRAATKAAGDKPALDPVTRELLADLDPQMLDRLYGEAHQEIGRRNTVLEKQRMVNAQDLQRRAADELALREAGEEVREPITKEQVFAAVKTPEEGERLWQSLSDDMRTADAVHSAGLMSTTAQDALLAQSKARLDALAPEQEGFADAAKNVEIIQKAIKANRDALEKDPAAYVLQRDETVSQAWQAAQADPTQTGKAIGTTMAVQRALGVPENLVRPMTADQAGGIVQRFDDALTAEDALGVLSSVTLQLGDDAMARRVLGQLEDAKLPAGASFALARLRDGDQVAARKIISATKIKPEQLPSVSEETKRDIGKAVDALYVDQTAADVAAAAASITGQPGYQQQAIRERQLLGRLVHIDAASGKDSATAATDALATLYGNREAIVEPDDFGAVLLPPGELAESLRGGFESIRRNLDLSYLQPPSEKRDFAFEQIVQDVRDGGLWVNNATGGFLLVNPHSGMAVVGPDRRPIVWSLGQIKDAAAGAAPDPVTGAPTQRLGASTQRFPGTFVRPPQPAGDPYNTLGIGQ